MNLQRLKAGFVPLLLVAVLELSAGYGSPAACGQGPTQPGEERRDADQVERQRHQHGGRRGDRHGPGWGGGDQQLRRLFRPAPEDHGPLRPGEWEELQTFLQQELPELQRVLDRLGRYDPDLQDKHLSRLLPRLRQLRRLHAQNPKLAELLARHSENLFRIEMLRRAWDWADDAERPPLERRIRVRVADNVGIQIDVLKLWAEQLKETRDARVAERLAAVTAADADLARESPEVRAQVAALAGVTDEAERQKEQDKLADLLRGELDRQIAGLGKRAQELEGGTEAEVDRHVHRIMRGPRPGRPGPRPGP